MLNRKSVSEQVVFRGFSLVLNLLVSILVPRILLPETNGVYALLVANMSIAVLVAGFSLESAIVYYISNRQFSFHGMIKALRVIFALQLVAVAVVLGVNSLLHNVVAFFPSQHTGIATMWAALFLLALLGNNLLMSVLNGLGRFRQVNLLNLCQALVQVLMLVTIMVTHRFSEHKIYIVYLLILSNFVGPLLALFLVRGESRKGEENPAPPARSRAIIKVLAQYAAIAFVANLVQQLAYRVDFWILDYYSGKTELGIYSVGTKLGQLVWVFPAALATIILPAVGRDGFRSVTGKIDKLLWATPLALLPVGGVMVVVTKTLLVQFLGPDYNDVWQPLALMLPGYVFFVWSVLLAPVFSGQKKVVWNLGISLWCLAVVLVADFVLIPRYGMNGAAIATTIAYTASGIASLLVYARLKKMKHESAPQQ
jgi:O-antigen/teichoic acid export membrane protein